MDNIYFAGAKSDGQQQSGYVDDGGTNPPATYRSQQPQQMGFATQNQRQQWQGANAAPEVVQPAYSQGEADDFSVIDDADDLPF